MKTKVIVLLIALCATMSVFADIKTGSCGDNLKWSYDTDTRILSITGGGYMNDYKYVQKNGDWYLNTPWQSYHKKIDSISIQEGVTSIGKSAFYGCTGLIFMIWNAKSCEDFESDNYPFGGQIPITSVTFGDSVQHIPAYLCYNMEKLTSVTISNSVTSIGGYAFYGCTGLTSITILNSVTSIGGFAFYGCTGLTSVTIGNGVTSIGYSAFSGCSNLETVGFSENVQDIGSSAFYGCQNIYEMTVKATKVPNVYESSFNGVSKKAELHVPAESVKKYKIHPVWGLFDVITAIPCVVTLHCDNVMGAVTGAGSYQANEQVNISASPNLGYRFRQWSDGITTNPRTLVVVGDTSLTAEFEEIPTSEYTVSVVVDAEQNGAVQMVLTAVPDAGYQFTKWSDGNTDNPRTILVTENMTLRATFNLSTETAAAPANEDGNGTCKLVRNGHVLIQRDGKTYTVTGAEIK